MTQHFPCLIRTLILAGDSDLSTGKVYPRRSPTPQAHGFRRNKLHTEKGWVCGAEFTSASVGVLLVPKQMLAHPAGPEKCYGNKTPRTPGIVLSNFLKQGVWNSGNRAGHV